MRQTHKQIEMDSPKKTIDDRSPYSLAQLSLFPGISSQQIAKWKNLKLARQMWTNPPKLIFDCSFEHFMNSREIKDTARQLQHAILDNRNHIDPFSLHLYNLNPNVRRF